MYDKLKFKNIGLKQCSLTAYELKKSLSNGEFNNALIKNNEIHVTLNFQKISKNSSPIFYIDWVKSFWGLKLYVISHFEGDIDNISICILDINKNNLEIFMKRKIYLSVFSRKKLFSLFLSEIPNNAKFTDENLREQSQKNLEYPFFDIEEGILPIISTAFQKNSKNQNTIKKNILRSSWYRASTAIFLDLYGSYTDLLQISIENKNFLPDIDDLDYQHWKIIFSENNPKLYFRQIFRIFHNKEFNCSDLMFFLLKNNLEVPEEISRHFHYLFNTSLRLNPKLTKGGLQLVYPTYSEGQLRHESFEIDYKSLTINECKDYWNLHNVYGTWMLDDLIKYENYVPASTNFSKWVNIQFSTDAKSLVEKADLILEEACALKKYIIPHGAILDMRFGPIESAQIFEKPHDITFFFKTSDNTFWSKSIDPIRKSICNNPTPDIDAKFTKDHINSAWQVLEEIYGKKMTESKIEVNSNYLKNFNDSLLISNANFKFLLANIIRDFWVVEKREKIYSVSQNPQSSKPRKASDKIIRYVPRVQYEFLDKETIKNKSEVFGSQKAKHFVNSHLRNANPTKFQIQVAERYGFKNLPEGKTFVKPHHRGFESEKEIIYRSRSLQKHYYVDKNITKDSGKDRWREFELYVQEVFKKLKFETQHCAPYDHNGIDILATKKKGDKILTYNIQCKFVSKKIGPNFIREMIGSLDELDDDSIGMIITNNYFTEEAIKKAEKASRKIELIDGDDLLKILNT